MTRYLIGGAIASAAFLLAGVPAPADAQRPVCAPRAVLVEMLSKRYGERLRVVARENRGFVVELHGGPSGSWTLVISHPNGKSCAVAAGRQHRVLPRSADGTSGAPGTPGSDGKPKSGIPTPAPSPTPRSAPAPKPRDTQF